jgi:hypothetical protein
MAAPDRQRLTRYGSRKDYQLKRLYAARTVGDECKHLMLLIILGQSLPPAVIPASRAAIA